MTTKSMVLNSLLCDFQVSLLYRSREFWPKVESSKMFVLEAVNYVGRSEFGEKWIGDELQAVVGAIEPLRAYQADLVKQIDTLEQSKFIFLPPSTSDPLARYLQPSESDFERKKAHDLSDLRRLLNNPPQNVVDDQDQWENNDAKVGRLRHVAVWIGNLARDGILAGYYQCAGEPELHALERAYWNCADDLTGWLLNAGKKIRHRSSDFIEPYIVDAIFFVCRDSLQRALSADNKPPVPQSSELDDLHLSPYMRLMLYVIQNEGIKPERQSSVEQLIEALKEAAPRFGLEVSSDDVSERLLKAMPTLMRERASRKGGKNRKGDTLKSNDKQ